MNEKIILIGGGGHSKVLIDIIQKNNLYDIIGYVDFEDLGAILGVKYLGGDNCLIDLYNSGVTQAVLGIGQVHITKKRFETVNKIKKIGFYFPAMISRNAIINQDVSIGEGTQVFEGAVVNCCTKIGEFTIINTNVTVEHDCKIGDFCHIATGAVLSGGVEIGDFSMIGSNAVVVQYKKIVSECLIGSGGVVIKDIFEKGIYVGNPVRKIK